MLSVQAHTILHHIHFSCRELSIRTIQATTVPHTQPLIYIPIITTAALLGRQESADQGTVVGHIAAAAGALTGGRPVK